MTYGCVIASYKYGHLAGHCIETVLEQTKKFDRVWFVDDCGDDCFHLPNLYPELTYVYRPKNLGTVANFQDMLERVDTDMVMFLGADNWIRPDTLELLSQKDTDIVVCDGVIVGTEKDWALDYFRVTNYEGGYYWDRFNQHHGSMLYNVAMAKKVGYWSDNEGNTLEDLNLFEGMKRCGAKVGHIREPLLYYRRHTNNFNKL